MFSNRFFSKRFWTGKFWPKFISPIKTREFIRYKSTLISHLTMGSIISRPSYYSGFFSLSQTGILWNLINFRKSLTVINFNGRIPKISFVEMQSIIKIKSKLSLLFTSGSISKISNKTASENISYVKPVSKFSFRSKDAGEK